MNHPFRVSLKWESHKMTNLPSSGVYSTVARFDTNLDWPNTASSIVIEFDENSDSSETVECTARFLAPEAAVLLKRGEIFELYEGFKRSAVVTVL